MVGPPSSQWFNGSINNRPISFGLEKTQHQSLYLLLSHWIYKLHINYNMVCFHGTLVEHFNSEAPWAKASYSDSVFDVATTLCLLEHHHLVFPLNKSRFPLTNLLTSMPDAESALQRAGKKMNIGELNDFDEVTQLEIWELLNGDVSKIGDTWSSFWDGRTFLPLPLCFGWRN